MRILLEQRLLCPEHARPGDIQEENLEEAVAHGEGFWYSNRAAKKSGSRSVGAGRGCPKRCGGGIVQRDPRKER
jgi:hypothetical protein